MQADLVQYLIESFLCLGILAIWYHLSIRKNRQHKLKTAFLTSAPIISFLIPMIRFEHLSVGGGNQIFWNPPGFFNQSEDLGLAFIDNASNQVSVSFLELLLVAYAVGVVISLIIVVRRVLSFHQKMKLSFKSVANGLSKSTKLPAQSWSNLVYLEVENRHFPAIINDFETPKSSFASILDVLSIDVIQSFAWMIPISLYLKKQFKINQFQALDIVLSNALSTPKDYTKQLFNLYQENSFEAKRCHLFERISAFEKRKQPIVGFLRMVSILPLMGFLAASFCFKNDSSTVADSQLTHISQNFSKALSADFIVLKEWEEPPPKMIWGGEEIPLTVIDNHTEIQFQVHVFDDLNFQHFQKELPLVYENDGTLIAPEFVRISVTGNDHLNYYNLECSDDQFDCIHKALDEMQAESSIQLVFQTEKYGQLYCILSDEAETMYIPEFAFIQDPFIFDTPKTLKSYGVKKMNKRSVNYKFVWGADMTFNLDEEYIEPITKERLIETIKMMPALSPIHGGLFEKFSFYVNVIDVNESQTSVFVEVNDGNTDAYYGNALLKDIIENASIDDRIYVDHISLDGGKEVGMFALRIVEDNTAATSPFKRNLASFNFTQNSTLGNVVKDESRQDKFLLKWGTYFIPLEMFASPNQFKAKLEIEPDAFKDIVGYPMEVLHNEEPIDPDSIKRFLSLNYFEGIGYSARNTLPFTDQGEIKLKDLSVEKLNKLNHTGMNYMVHGAIGDISLNGLEIRIIDPDGPYVPPINLFSSGQYQGEEFSFQVIQGLGKEKTIIKLDSLDPGSANIIKMYRDESKYTIIQIPGFKTRKRLISPDVKTLYSKPKKLAKDILSMHHLKEFVLSTEHSIEARWGRMVASPVSGNYGVREFRRSANQNFIFLINSEIQKVIQAEIKVFSGDKITHHFITQDLNHEIIRRTLQNVQSRGSVYISNIVIDDTRSKEPLIIPQDFAFVVE